MISDVIHTNFTAKFPSKNYAHVVGELLHLLPDPAFKLKFIHEAVNEHNSLPELYKYFPLLEKSVYWKTLLDRLERIRPGSKHYAKQLTRQGIISIPRMPLWIIYRFRYFACLVLLALFVSSVGKPVGSFMATRSPVADSSSSVIEKIAANAPQPDLQPEPPIRPASAEPPIQATKAVVAPSPEAPPIQATKTVVAPSPEAPPGQDTKTVVTPSPEAPPGQDAKMAADTPPKVGVQKYLSGPIWLVEKKQDTEVYSNGLHIITTHTLANTPRSYYRLARNPDQPPVSWHRTDQVSGILYHASESDIFPFIPEMNKSIKRYSEALIRYIKPKKSYHYFIDRFGRVYRLVQEDHAANHAGNSIWADDESIYLNLNNAFIGICFEGRDFEKIAEEKTEAHRNAQGISADIRPVRVSSFNEAQLRSGKELTDWLRVKYNIAQNNCVPHALASVNPDKMLIGYHLDLSRGFPFNQFGLSNKYNEPLPSMVEFGFAYDSYFQKIFDGSVWPGIGHAEKLLIKRARESGIDPGAYVKTLQEKYNRCAQWQPTRGKQPESRVAQLKS